MLVVSDKLSLWISRKGGFACTRKSEEKCNIAVLSFVGAWMERENSSFWHEVMHDREDSLLHFSSILSSEDDNLPLAEVQWHRSLWGDSLDSIRGREFTSIEDVIVDIFREIFRDLIRSRNDEHISHKESVVSSRANNSDPNAVFWVPSSITIDNVQLRWFLLSYEEKYGYSWSGVEISDSSFF